MRTVNIGDLKNQLSAYLQYVRNGEEIIVRDRNLAIARILPVENADLSEHEMQLVASGAMKLPQQEMDWEAFWALPRPRISHKRAVEAALESRGDR
jgi:antitoxin (DNA-binding transcriptional repressor) of toxin-antitoxin stability system